MLNFKKWLALLLALALLAGFSGRAVPPQNETPTIFLPYNDDIPASDPYENVDKEAFYANYTPAANYMDAYYRSQHFLLSGSLEVPSPEVEAATNQPMENGKYVRNTSGKYLNDGNTYVVLDASGREDADRSPVLLKVSCMI